MPQEKAGSESHEDPEPAFLYLALESYFHPGRVFFSRNISLETTGLA